MQYQIFIGGLSWNTTEQRLEETFAAFGKVNAVKVVMDKMTGRSRGFGFVTFESEDDCTRAIAEMDGQELDGRAIKVSLARARTEGEGGGERSSFRRNSGGGGGGFGGARRGGFERGAGGPRGMNSSRY